jgi:outer membrane protein assembly factor BamB
LSAADPDASNSKPPTTPVPRRRIGILTILGLALLGVAVAIQLFGTDLVGDHAVANSMVVSIALLITSVGTLRVIFSRRYRTSVRLGLLAAAIAIPGGFFTLFRLDGFSAEMVPRYVLRFGSPARRPAATTEGAAPDAKGRAVDLKTTTPWDFPQFLGVRRDAAVEGIRLARDWSNHPPGVIWKRDVGEGWSGFAIVNGFGVTFEQHGDEEFVTCYDIATGAPRWTHRSPGRYELLVAGTGPRSTPTIHQGRVYALGATGRLLCLDGATGESVWEHDLRSEFQISAEDDRLRLQFGRANSPLIVDDLVIIPVGGASADSSISLAAYHKESGDLVWTGGERHISYSSPIVTELRGTAQVLIVNEDTVSAHDPRSGRVLWEFPWPGSSSANANCSQVVPIGEDRVLVSKGYFQGAAVWEIGQSSSAAWEPRPVWSAPRVLKTKFTNVAVHEGHAYGLSDGILECVELTSGRSQWKGGRYGHGQILRVRDLLLVLTEEGELVLIELSPREKNKVLGRIQAIEGKTWNTLALSGSRLLVRNAREAACIELPLEEHDPVTSP